MGTVKQILENKRVRALVKKIPKDILGESTSEACKINTFVTLEYESTPNTRLASIMDVVFKVPDAWKNKYTHIIFHTTNNHYGVARRSKDNPNYAYGACEKGHIYDDASACNDKIPELIVEYR